MIPALERLPALVRFEADMHRRIESAFHHAAMHLMDLTPGERAEHWADWETAYQIVCATCRHAELHRLEQEPVTTLIHYHEVIR